jgi:hypothetical protein
MDETYVRIKGVWKYLYRAVDKASATVDFLLTAKRDRKAALRFLHRAIGQNGRTDAHDPEGPVADERLEPVAVYTVGTGVDDLAAMLLEEREGFLPRARMIILNEARAPLGTPRETAFRALMRSKAHQAAMQGGTMQI